MDSLETVYCNNKIYWIECKCISIKFVSISDQKCKILPTLTNIDSNVLFFYPYNIFVNKCIGHCNNINKPYAHLGVPDVVKYINMKVFNLILRTNETGDMSYNKTRACKCRLDASVYNDKKRWGSNKCRCEFKELTHKGRCDDGFVWSPSICERHKSCYVAEFLDYENCKCGKKLNDKLVLEFKYEVVNSIPINTADTISIADKKVTCKKNCLISIN